MTTDRERHLEVLRRTPAALAQRTRGLSDAALEFHPAATDWSIREILAHLVDDEMFVMRTRVERMIKEPTPHLAPHDEQAWYAARNTSRDRLDQLLDDFALQRSASLGMIALLGDREWQRTGFQPEYGEFTVETWLGRWAEHDTAHLDQIDANLRAFQERGHSS